MISITLVTIFLTISYFNVGWELRKGLKIYIYRSLELGSIHKFDI